MAAPLRAEGRPERVQIGAWRVTALLDGTMRLDGGGMWGVVPKALWAKLTPPDEDNTIPLALRPFLLERDGLRVVLEPGVGGHLSEKWARNYAIDRTTTLRSSLAALGLAPADVTHVVASHCHFDHIGGWLERDAHGALAPLRPIRSPERDSPLRTRSGPSARSRAGRERPKPLSATGCVR